MGLIGGAVGGFIASLFHLAATGMAITVIPGTLLYMNHQLPLYILANVAAMAVAFVLTWMFGYNDKMLEEVKTAGSSN
ncbi:PTS sugar transporter subunit IIA, partial [Paenibacillus sp. NRS-1782]